MSPWRRATSLAQRYDQALQYAWDDSLPADAPRPLPSCHWAPGNLEFLERYRAWLLDGGISELVTNLYHILMAGHVFGLTLKPYADLDPDTDLACALEYVKAKGLSAGWIKNCRRSLDKFRRFLRLERGLGEESHVTPFDPAVVTSGLPDWLVSELVRYQRLMQRNWREARVEQDIRRFWSGYLRMWGFLCKERGVQQLADVKRPFILDYLDMRLQAGYSVSGVNSDLRYFHTFLLFLQDEGYSVPQSLLRVPGLKQPEPLPKYLTDEQVRLLRDHIEQAVADAPYASRRRQALLLRAAFYLLWQAGMRLGEVEELRLEDLELAQRRLSVRDGKGRKDRTVYLTDTAIRALQAYLAVRWPGTADHVFLYRHAPLKKDMVRGELKAVGERVGVKVYPHRLRHTCATQLLNAGCRITSIQKFLGHKKLGTTMIYAKVLDPTLAEDYFKAMERVEQRLEIVPLPQQVLAPKDEIVKVPPDDRVFDWIERLALPELCHEERLEIAGQLKQALVSSYASRASPPLAV